MSVFDWELFLNFRQQWQFQRKQLAKKYEAADSGSGAGSSCITRNEASSSRTNNTMPKEYMFAVNTGVCQDVMRRSNIGQVCDVSFGDNACVDGYVCLGANGRRIGKLGIGICTLRSTIEVVND